MPGSTVEYYFSDQLKTASVITDSSGNIKAESDFYPWGGELALTANDSNHYKFTGKERDGETGLDYFGARYYSSGMGRFVTPDWAAKAAAVPYADLRDPQSLNLYSYVRNRPTVLVDIDGHEDGAAASKGVNCGGLSNCSVSKTTSYIVYTNDHTVTVYTREITEASGTDANGNKVERWNTTNTTSTYSRETGEQGTFLSATQRSSGVMQTTYDQHQTFDNPRGTTEARLSPAIEEHRISESESMKAMGGEGVSRMIDAARPSLVWGAITSAADHKWETLERGASAAGLVVCLAVPGCAEGLAGAAAAGFGILEGTAGIMNGLNGH